MVSVDGDTSTNDTVLASWQMVMAGNPKITEEGADFDKLYGRHLTILIPVLSKKIAGDGEGATALFEVKIHRCKDKRSMQLHLVKSVVTSSLTKAAIYGHDANWGRILCAMGYSGVQFDPEKVDLYFESRAGKAEDH